MKRDLFDKLLLWKDRPTRKPLILRGARQVGKTHLVRELAKAAFEHFVEVNFEESAGLAPLFRSKDPAVIGELLADKFSTPVVDGRTLLFLDELQAAEPYVLESLRYFREKRPRMHVVAAGRDVARQIDNIADMNFPDVFVRHGSCEIECAHNVTPLCVRNS